MKGLLKWYRGECDGQEKLTDLIRATVTVNEKHPHLVVHVLQDIAAHPDFNLIRVKNRLKDLRHLSCNFLFRNQCVCEVQIRMGKPSPFLYYDHFLYQVLRMREVFEVVETLNNKAAWLANHGLLRLSKNENESIENENN